MPDPIPNDLIQAFRNAIDAFVDWDRGDIERQINYAGQLWSNRCDLPLGVGIHRRDAG
jgi:hypothetical protein